MNHENGGNLLLVRLALKGDPSAFYTLFRAEIEGLYGDMRSNGTSHEQSLSALLPFVRGAYRKYVGVRHKTEPREWFQEQREHLATPNVSRSGDTVYLDSRDHDGTEDLGIQVLRVLQREYGRHRNENTKRGKGERSGNRNPVVYATTVVALLIVVAILVNVVLVVSDTGVELTFSSGSREFVARLPIEKGPRAGAKQTAASAWQEAVAQSQSREAEVIEDTLGPEAPKEEMVAPSAPPELKSRVVQPTTPKPVRRVTPAEAVGTGPARAVPSKAATPVTHKQSSPPDPSPKTAKPANAADGPVIEKSQPAKSPPPEESTVTNGSLQESLPTPPAPASSSTQ